MARVGVAPSDERDEDAGDEGVREAAAPLLDAERLGAYLAAAIPGFGTLRRVEKFAGGQSNPTFLLEADGGRFVLRRKPPGKLLRGAHAVDREFRVMAALAGTDVPVPRVRHLCADESVCGAMFYVMDHVAGRVFFEARMPDLSVEQRAAAYDAMNDTLARLHRIDPAGIGLADFGRPGGYFARQRARWVENYRASATRSRPEIDAAIAWLEANEPPDDGSVALVHGDFRHDNMIFGLDATGLPGPQGAPAQALGPDAPRSAVPMPRVLALIDWELSTLGHPLADLAYQVAQWRLPAQGAFFKGLGGLDRAALGIPGEEAYVEAYMRRRGLADLPHWRFAVVFSLFRLAAILEGVYRRALDGNASNRESGLLMGETVPVLARLAAEEIARG